MGKAANRIIDGLTKANVSEADRERAKDLIDEAPDRDPAQAAEIEAIVRYVCGVGDKPSPSADVLENRTSGLLGGLSKERTLDAYDLRALDVIATCQPYSWFWELDRWLRDRVEKFPAAPIFDEALELFRARGLWPDDTAVIKSMLGQLSCHVTDNNEVTSTGRWLLVQLDRDPEAVFAIARADKRDRTSRLYRLLLAQRRELFEKLQPTLTLSKDSDKSFLAEVMLEVDANHWETQAVALMAELKDGLPAVYSARNLEKFFPGKYTPDVKRLLVAAMQTADGDTHELAYKLAFPALGDEAADVWKAYDNKNDAFRLEFYETIEQQAKATAVPYLIDGLVYPKDPKIEYGGVTHAKYVQRILQLLKPYDLTPYRDRIATTFAKTKDKKIRELIDGVLGAAPAKAKAKPKGKSFSGKDGYRFEAYVDAITKAALAATETATLPSPIESIKLTGMQGEVQLDVLLLEGAGDPVAIELAAPPTRIPPHVDVTEDDTVLPAFVRRHELDEAEAPMWSDMHKLPWCVLLHEQIGAARAIATGLAAQGHEVAKSCKIGVGEEDSFFESTESFERMAREEIAALPKAQQADFAALCFEDPEKQKWLLKQ